MSSQGSEIKAALEHVHELVLSRNAQQIVNGESLIGRINTFIAVKITKIVGSMWCAYVFAILALISLPAAIASGSPIIIIGWIAQTFLQLVLLPIIIVGQNVQAAASDKRAEKDHETLMAIHTLSAQIYKINRQQTQILDLLDKTSK